MFSSDKIFFAIVDHINRQKYLIPSTFMGGHQAHPRSDHMSRPRNENVERFTILSVLLNLFEFVLAFKMCVKIMELSEERSSSVIRLRAGEKCCDFPPSSATYQEQGLFMNFTSNNTERKSAAANRTEVNSSGVDSPLKW